MPKQTSAMAKQMMSLVKKTARIRKKIPGWSAGFATVQIESGKSSVIVELKHARAKGLITRYGFDNDKAVAPKMPTDGHVWFDQGIIYLSVQKGGFTQSQRAIRSYLKWAKTSVPQIKEAKPLTETQMNALADLDVAELEAMADEDVVMADEGNEDVVMADEEADEDVVMADEGDEDVAMADEEADEDVVMADEEADEGDEDVAMADEDEPERAEKVKAHLHKTAEMVATTAVRSLKSAGRTATPSKNLIEESQNSLENYMNRMVPYENIPDDQQEMFCTAFAIRALLRVNSNALEQADAIVQAEGTFFGVELNTLRFDMPTEIEVVHALTADICAGLISREIAVAPAFLDKSRLNGLAAAALQEDDPFNGIRRLKIAVAVLQNSDDKLARTVGLDDALNRQKSADTKLKKVLADMEMLRENIEDALGQYRTSFQAEILPDKLEKAGIVMVESESVVPDAINDFASAVNAAFTALTQKDSASANLTELVDKAATMLSDLSADKRSSPLGKALQVVGFSETYLSDQITKARAALQGFKEELN